MSTFREAIESRIGSTGADYIDTVTTLSTFYGPDSLACHGLRRLDEIHIESYFIVSQNLCGPNARPPMFDRIHFQGDLVEVETGVNDAREHFIETVVINNTPVKVIPGHNLAGLLVEIESHAFNRGKKNPLNLMLTGFDFIRYRGFVLPHQKLMIAGAITKDKAEVLFSPDIAVRGQPRVRASKFRLEVADPIDEETRIQMLDQHWLLETTAQGFGAAASLGRSIEGKVPVLMQSEKTNFAKSPIKAGDLITTRFELLPSPSEQGFGNAEIFVNGIPYGTQRRLMVQFFPIEKIAEGIEATRSIT